jgi:hypothetical protein
VKNGSRGQSLAVFAALVAHVVYEMGAVLIEESGFLRIDALK